MLLTEPNDPRGNSSSKKKTQPIESKDRGNSATKKASNTNLITRSNMGNNLGSGSTGGILGSSGNSTNNNIILSYFIYIII